MGVEIVIYGASLHERAVNQCRAEVSTGQEKPVLLQHSKPDGLPIWQSPTKFLRIGTKAQTSSWYTSPPIKQFGPDSSVSSYGNIINSFCVTASMILANFRAKAETGKGLGPSATKAIEPKPVAK
jgi:hypothetical protein